MTKHSVSDDFERRDGWVGFLDRVREEFMGADLEKEYWDRVEKEHNKHIREKRAMNDDEFRENVINDINNDRESLGLERIDTEKIHIARDEGCYIAHVSYDEDIAEEMSEYSNRKLIRHLNDGVYEEPRRIPSKKGREIDF